MPYGLWIFEFEKRYVISCTGQLIGSVNRGRIRRADERHISGHFFSFLFVRSASTYGDTERSWLVGCSARFPVWKGRWQRMLLMDTWMPKEQTFFFSLPISSLVPSLRIVNQSYYYPYAPTEHGSKAWMAQSRVVSQSVHYPGSV